MQAARLGLGGPAGAGDDPGVEREVQVLILDRELGFAVFGETLEAVAN